MKYLILVLIFVGLCMPYSTQMVIPYFPTLEWQHMKMFVDTTETGWALDAASWFPLIINDTGGDIFFRFDTETDSVTSIVKNGGCGPWIPPVVMPAFVDSIFMTAEVSDTVHIEWYAE